MIKISRETGTVTWADYSLHKHLTLEMFTKLYAEVKCSRAHYKGSRVQERRYRFPQVTIDTYPVVPQITYVDDRLLHVTLEMTDVYYFEEQADLCIKQLFARSQSLRDLLIRYLGQPQRFNPYCFGFFDEARALTMEEIEALQAWEYDFEWGSARTSCFYEQGVILTGFDLTYSLSKNT